jgi:hypothetical protein
MAWKERATLGERIIPPHLKLAALARGHISLPPENVKWLLDEAIEKGASWLSRLSCDLTLIFKELHVTIELFLNQRPAMTDEEIKDTLYAYLSLRRTQRLQCCHFLPFKAGVHTERRTFEQFLDVDLTELYKRANITSSGREPRRYILLAFVCLPKEITKFISPIPTTARPATGKPPLKGMLSVIANLRKEPSDSSELLGENAGSSIPVAILDKAEDDKKRCWYNIKLGDALPVLNDEKPLSAGTICWTVSDNLLYVAAPWAFFRSQLSEFEKGKQDLDLDKRITKLRQMSHTNKLPFDTAIGTEQGDVYQDTLPFISEKWQLLKDYEQVCTPDGRIVDIKHILVGLDALQHPPERGVKIYATYAGKNYAIASWSGDLGAAAADMTLKQSAEWERRNHKATYLQRAEYYFATRSPEWDLLADIDIWGIHDLRLRSPDLASIDSLLTFYYEKIFQGSLRQLVSGRKDALERFFKQYGFTYNSSSDFQSLNKQKNIVNKLWNGINDFAIIWMFYRKPMLLAESSEKRKKVNSEDVYAMTEYFIYWLEYTAGEHGVEMK